jgi:glutamate racemase
VLGCTHYPLLKPALRAVVGDSVKLVDSAESCAQFVQGRLEALKLLRANRRRTGTIQPFVTDELERFDELAQRFLGQKTEPAWKIDLLPV